MNVKFTGYSVVKKNFLLKICRAFVIFAGILFMQSAVVRAENSPIKGNEMQGKTVYIIHGYMAGPSDHWFEWLKEQVEGNGGKAHIIAMPNSSNPDAKVWTQTLEAGVGTLDDDTFIVAHSLGGISTLRFLSHHSDETIGGLILVSSFENKLPTIPDLDGFIDPKGFDAERIKSMAVNRVVFASDNDPYVDPALTQSLANSLDAPLYQIHGGGHFLSEDGYTTFPAVWSKLETFAVH